MTHNSDKKNKSFGARLKEFFFPEKSPQQLETKFNTIYEKNLFKGKESISGPGSDLKQTDVIRKKLPQLLQSHQVHSMIDAPCGDFFWMRHVELNNIHYTGIDIVAELVSKNNEQFKNEQREFMALNIVSGDLPKADLIFCRDCLVHLSNEEAKKAIRNFKRSGATYLLTTTFTSRKSNPDLGTIIWRPLNLCLAPFNFPEPVEVLLEECTEDGGQYADKSLGLWKLSDLNV